MVRVSGIDRVLKSQSALKVVKFASDNPALFASGATLGFSTFVRPIAIMSTPKTDRDDKKYAILKSITSAIVGFGLTYSISKPLEKAIKAIENSPEKFFNHQTLDYLKKGGKSLTKSQKYIFSTQFFLTSVGFLLAQPKAFLTCAAIPLLDKLFKDKNLSYGSGSNISKGIAKVMETKTFQKITDKFSNTNLVQNMAFASDILLTGIFINQVKKNKEIPKESKAPLINNTIFSTLLSIFATLGLNKISDKPTDKFIDKFLKLNKDLKNQKKYVQGIKNIKTVLIMGGVYYTIIPLLSTFMASLVKKSQKNTQV